MMSQSPGTVSLVGAGPGDPGLLTLRAKQRLEEADVVVHDHLVSPAIMTLVPLQVERIYVGKWAGERIMSQEAIGQVLVEQARRGRRVVRLKGGDVFLFGRGGEECSCLQEHGIGYEIVPGITSALSVPAYAGIPVTDRRFSSSLMVITGHEGEGDQGSRVDWSRAAHGADTLVVLMGTRRIETIMSQLIANGRPASQPAAMISWGTLGQQETRVGTVESLPGIVDGMKPPTVIVVGDVVGLRSSIRWFENRPLFGKKVLNTRPRERGGNLTRALCGMGAQVVDYPLLDCKVKGEEHSENLDASLVSADWLVVTSAYAAMALKEWNTVVPEGCLVAAVGEACASALEEAGIAADLIPLERNAEGLCEALIERERSLEGKKVVFAKGTSGKDTVEQRLTARGAHVIAPVVYEVKPLPAQELADLARRVHEKEFQVGVITSPLSAHVWSESVAGSRELPVVAMSNAVSDVLKAEGVQVAGVARIPGDQELIEALVDWALRKEPRP